MLRTLSVLLSLGLLACGGKPANHTLDEPIHGGSGDDTTTPTETKTCCCETYDLETPDIGYSTMATAECTAASGHCEDTDEYCQAE